MKSIRIVLAVVLTTATLAHSQEQHEFGGKQSIGIAGIYAPDSSHILIGISEQRRIWTAGGEYTRRILNRERFRIDYAGGLNPFFKESDPTLVGFEATVMPGAPPTILKLAPTRVVIVTHAPIKTVCGVEPTCYPVYNLYGRESTYGAAISPLGARISMFPRLRLQPSFETDMGVVISTRDLPIEDTAKWNYQFSFGPGVQIFSARNTAIRLEYIYRHISNAGSGELNPGIDQCAFRLTLSKILPWVGRLPIRLPGSSRTCVSRPVSGFAARHMRTQL